MASSKEKEKEENETKHEGPEEEGAQVHTRLCCPFFLALNPALNCLKSVQLAGKG